MHNWFQKLFKSTQREQEVTKNSSSLNVSSTTSSASALGSPSTSSPSKLLQSQSVLNSRSRWSRKYDVFVCHSSVDSDSEEAGRLVSFLEASPHGLRCFLRQRDDTPGGAIPTELCEALQNSHLWALLITPNFLQDEWCMYMMHQALAEAPMSARIIPLRQNLSHTQYPQELKFYYYIDLSFNSDRGYSRISRTVLKYLEDLAKSEKTRDCNMDSSGKGLSEENSTKKTS
ncbi:toll/interleukin-1 receptor domain-containing adapter protein [Larimichthys crocea]|uniref:toll/interleukin-1 receptor domain-containing adapter protein n=1 Tax=Larimichthys crocea TaxID=215358 RepID=UPI00054BB692|nr:toll/interleukin-1 receptor domain-containing adapter protein [Larimichthys crocea]